MIWGGKKLLSRSAQVFLGYWESDIIGISLYHFVPFNNVTNKISPNLSKMFVLSHMFAKKRLCG